MTIVTLASSLIAVSLLAAGTPRQATLLFGHRSGRTVRRATRLAGWLLLAGSLGVVLSVADRARQFLLWVGICGIEALAIALLFTLIARRRSASGTGAGQS